MYTVNKFVALPKNRVNVRFYNNYTCRFIIVICFVYMGDNTN